MPQNEGTGETLFFRNSLKEMRRGQGAPERRAIGRNSIDGSGHFYHAVIIMRDRTVPRFTAESQLQPADALFGGLAGVDISPPNNHAHSPAFIDHVFRAHHLRMILEEPAYPPLSASFFIGSS